MRVPEYFFLSKENIMRKEIGGKESLFNKIKKVLPAFREEVIEGQRESIKILNQRSIIEILKSAYGDKYWQVEEKDYWREVEEWNFKPISQQIKDKWPSEVKRTYNYLKTILEWTYDPETRGHLDPAPGIPVYKDGKIVGHRLPDPHKIEEVDHAIAELARHYFNKGQPQNIMPLLSVNPKKTDELLALGTIRWKGDKYIPSGERIASLEGLMVNPKHRREGVGIRLVATAIDYAFYKYTGYGGRRPGGQGAKEVRAWVMSDKQAGNYSINLNFFHKLGFHIMASPRRYWEHYASMIDEETDRDALWLNLKEEEWERKRKEDLSILSYAIIEE